MTTSDTRTAPTDRYGIAYTGERYLPWSNDFITAYEHIHRYLYATRYTAGKRVLDIACGEGYGTQMLARNARWVLGVDSDATTLKHARMHHGGKNIGYARADAQQFHLAPSSVDVIVSFETLEHFPAQQEFLDAMKACLASDGILLLSTPNRAVYSGDEPLHNPFHAREFNRAELLTLLKARFKHVGLYGQHMIASSLIARTTGETFPRRGSSFVPVSTMIAPDALDYPLIEAGEIAPRYFFVVCSDAPLPSIPATFLLDTHQTLWEYLHTLESRLTVRAQEAETERGEARTQAQRAETALAEVRTRVWEAETRAWEAETEREAARTQAWRAETERETARTQAWRAETRAWQAETEREAARTRAWRAETEREEARTRLWEVETRAWQVETELAGVRTRVWEAETEREEARTQAWRAETRAWQAETEREAARTQAWKAETALAEVRTQAWRAETEREEARAQAWRAETEREEARTRVWEAETRAWEAETEREAARTQVWEAETRAWQAETGLYETEEHLRASEAQLTRVNDAVGRLRAMHGSLLRGLLGYTDVTTPLRALVLIPGGMNYFYDQAGHRLAESLTTLGFAVDVSSLSALPEDHPQYDWTLVVNIAEVLLAYGVADEVARQAGQMTPEEQAHALARIVQVRAGSRATASVQLDSAGTYWFDHAYNLCGLAGIENVFDLGFHDQSAVLVSHQRARYQFVFNGLTESERGQLDALPAYDARPVPWVFVGHLTPDRTDLVRRLVEEFDPRGFVYMPMLAPFMEGGPHLDEAQFATVLSRAQYQVWRSHHAYFYLESERFRQSALAGGVPVKLMTAPLPPGALPFREFLVDAESFAEVLHGWDFATMRQRVADEFRALPSLDDGLLAALAARSPVRRYGT